MTSILKELFVGAANAVKLMDHRTSEAMALLKEHHDSEIAHDIKRNTATYGEHSRMVFNGEGFNGLDQIEKAHIAVGFGNEGTFADIDFEIFKYHQSQDAIAVEFGFKAKHVGEFGGISPTGKQIEIPAVGIYSFDLDGNLVQENITFDTGAILRQIS
ncbi:ester cyclase [Pseudanabaena sp. 'Roaring Creek']|uniref:ester cyclase n=1 Tax=Pseudanabaena sp. 'Roaring Creek' TaxID=1681830 RepID=UPI0006D7F7E2|nr:ester cyclase [Pseudanabaena sp. 'Roaring Creek']